MMKQIQKAVAPAPAPVGYERVCVQVRAAIEPARTHCVSLHDASGDVLWMSESSMGPDEHNAVRDAAENFREPHSPEQLAYDLGDARTAVLIRSVGAQRATLGIVMLVIDSRALGSRDISQDPHSLNKIMNPAMRRTLEEFSKLRIIATTLVAPAQAAPKRAQAPITPEVDRLNAELRSSPITLHVQRLVPLAKGGTLRRYEILLRSKSAAAEHLAPQAMLRKAVANGLGSMIDRRVLTELIGWLSRNTEVWQNDRAMFSVNLTTTALHDEHFMKFVQLCLTKASIPGSVVAFEVDVQTAQKLRNQISDIAVALQRIGCPLVLDDFNMRTESFDLLKLPGVKLLKLEPTITSRMRTDKLAQASITAVAQMARVLGIHTVAKRTESPAEQEWLTALGVDFVQSNAFSAPVAIESLVKA